MTTVIIETNDRNYLPAVGDESYEEDGPSDEENEEKECDFSSSFVKP